LVASRDRSVSVSAFATCRLCLVSANLHFAIQQVQAVPYFVRFQTILINTEHSLSVSLCVTVPLRQNPLKSAEIVVSLPLQADASKSYDQSRMVPAMSQIACDLTQFSIVSANQTYAKQNQEDISRQEVLDPCWLKL